jgi:uncharacterized protein
MPEQATPLLFGLLAVGVAGIISGLTGFGFALVTTPLLVLILPPTVVVPVVALLSLLSHLVVLLETLPWIRLNRIWLLALAAVIGAPLGTYLLLALDAAVLKVLIGMVTTLSALALLFGFTRPIRNERLASLPVGLASGLLGGSTGMSGPPVVLFFSNQGVDKHVFRANLNLYFILLACSTLPSQAIAGLITREVLTYAAWFIAALLLGTLAGMRLARRVHETDFRRVTLVVVIASGLSAIASALQVI